MERKGGGAAQIGGCGGRGPFSPTSSTFSAFNICLYTRLATSQFSQYTPQRTPHSRVLPLPQQLLLPAWTGGCGRSLLYEPLTEAVTISYPRKHPRRSVWVVGSCNGLICIAINEKDLFLWNPSVRKSKKLPDVDVPMGRGFCIVYGFGFDETTEDYKVVGIFCAFGNAGGCETMVKIYSLKTNSWRRIEDFKGGVPLDDSGMFAQGKLHWSASPGEGFSSGWDIVSLDLKREIYGTVEQPNYGEGDFTSVLGVLGECISVLCNYQKTRADVWVLKEYGVKESWTKVISIPYIYDPGKYMYSMPLCILPNGEVLLALGSSFVVYNLKDNSFKSPKITNVTDFLGAITYVESLVSPDADGE
ncbi:unnamed protein product [Fraxinus pennsylvanica]|uniref:F-box associated beta-propeller type 3 domain-containing protein n=1 Tax=Fraxinus pennsylvanica TaxID=56036 RepID=A0AAD1ZJT2_9LAMI|nr:unnamed protein product [Fraxinus pennsylvanica]